jgi:hypothetical protein
MTMKVTAFIMAAAGLATTAHSAEIAVTVEPSDAEVSLVAQKPDTTRIGQHTSKDGRHVWEVEGAPGDMLSLYVKRPQFITALEFVPASGKELKISLKYSAEYAEALQSSAFREKIEQDAVRSREEQKSKTKAALLGKYRDRGERVTKAFKDNAPALGMPVEMVVFIFGEPATRTRTSRAKGTEESLSYAQPEITFFFTDDRLTRWSVKAR